MATNIQQFTKVSFSATIIPLEFPPENTNLIFFLDFVAYGHGQRVMPAIWFRYEVSPITVKYTHKKKPIYHFLTTFCAIIGGTFTVAGMIDSMIFSAHNMVKKASEGKLS